MIIQKSIVTSKRSRPLFVRATFPKTLLVCDAPGTSDSSGIAWYNPAKHTQIFPFNPVTTTTGGVGAGVFTTGVKIISYSNSDPAQSPAYQPSLELFAVDTSGNDILSAINNSTGSAALCDMVVGFDASTPAFDFFGAQIGGNTNNLDAALYKSVAGFRFNLSIGAVIRGANFTVQLASPQDIIFSGVSSIGF